VSSHLFILVILGLSYNQPKFCPFATWNPNAITFANNSIIGSSPHGIFVDASNTVYVLNQPNNRVYIWANDSINATRIISGNSLNLYAIFVTMNGDIYIENRAVTWRVDKWTFSTNNWTSVMYVNTTCYGLFVDINNTLYCSMYYRHQVAKKWLNDNANTSSIAAGTGTPNSTSNTLAYPCGIFVDTNFDLYVADAGNNRIQLFRSDQLNAITVAGTGSPNITITLSCPTGIVLDADKYLFIVDQYNHRIVRSGPTGFRCIVGCSGTSGSSSNQLSSPYTLRFDSYGNIFVADRDNGRIQKFILEDKYCGKFYFLRKKEQL
jgi:sugar lactone lactonase YvrE